MPEWFETFFAGLYGEVLAATFSEADSLAQANLISRLLELRPGEAVLDIPCGMGRLALPLARMGFRVTGVDIEKRFVEEALREAQKDNLDARFIVADMREIDFESEFDAAFNYFTSFGYFSDADNLEFLRKLRAALRPGGRFAVELINKAWLVMNFRAETTDELAGVSMKTHRRWDATGGRITAETVFEKGGRAERRDQSVRVYSPSEVAGLLEEAGFEDVRLFGVDGRGAPAPDSPRFTALARG